LRNNYVEHNITQPITSSTSKSDSAQDGPRDFEFYMGRWHLDGKKLLKSLTGSSESESFEARVHTRPLPGGIGN
jgi:hypothetical protein